MDLQSQRLLAANRLANLTQQLETLERTRPDAFTPEDRTRLAALETALQDLRRQQQEVVEHSFKNMYELGHMVQREREELLIISGQGRGKVARYEQALALIN